MTGEKRKQGRRIVSAKFGEKATLGIRATGALKERLVAEANKNDRSLSQEAELRLEKSFASDDEAGGPVIAHMFRMMTAAFLLGGQRGAAARQHPEWTPAEWINDAVCYDAAVQSVLDVLQATQPQPYESHHPDPAQRDLHQRFHNFFARQIARDAEVIVKKGDDNG